MALRCMWFTMRTGGSYKAHRKPGASREEPRIPEGKIRMEDGIWVRTLILASFKQREKPHLYSIQYCPEAKRKPMFKALRLLVWSSASNFPSSSSRVNLVMWWMSSILLAVLGLFLIVSKYRLMAWCQCSWDRQHVGGGRAGVHAKKVQISFREPSWLHSDLDQWHKARTWSQSF